MYIGDDKLSSYVGITINHYRIHSVDPIGAIGISY